MQKDHWKWNKDLPPRAKALKHHLEDAEDGGPQEVLDSLVAVVAVYEHNMSEELFEEEMTVSFKDFVNSIGIAAIRINSENFQLKEVQNE